MSKLKTAYDAAVEKLGDEMPLALARAFGGVAGIDDVPADRVNGLVAALTRVTSGGQISAAMAKAAAHGASGPAPRKVHADVFEDDGEPIIPKSLADLHTQAYLRWNRQRQKD